MPIFIEGALILGGFLLLAWLFVHSDVRQLLLAIRYGLGTILVVGGLIFMYFGRVFVGAAMLAGGASAFFQGRIGPWSLTGTSRSGGQASRVATAHVEMTLDHDTGAMGGRVLAGVYAGRALDDLDENGLRALLAEVAADPDSARLVEAYLDRRYPGWREGVEENPAAGTGGAPGPGAMSEQEAYEVLGLKPGAGQADIRAAHRRLIKLAHPDLGGSAFLAAKINQAKDRLLSKHR